MTDTYHIWFNLRDGVDDASFCEHLETFLSHLDEGTIQEHRLQRRKLGFGPPELGEFHLTMEVENLEQLDRAFRLITPRAGETEKRHAAVWSRVTDFRSGLFRDYPDPERVG